LDIAIRELKIDQEGNKKWNTTYTEILHWNFNNDRKNKFNTLWFSYVDGILSFHPNSYYSLQTIYSNLKNNFETPFNSKPLTQSVLQSESEQSSSEKNVSSLVTKNVPILAQLAIIQDQTYLETFYNLWEQETKDSEKIKQNLEKIFKFMTIDKSPQWFNLNKMNNINFLDSNPQPIDPKHEKMYHFIFVIYFRFYNLFLNRTLELFDYLLKLNNDELLEKIPVFEIRIIFAIMFVDIFESEKFFPKCRKNFLFLETKKQNLFSQFFSNFDPKDTRIFIQQFSNFCLLNNLLQKYSIISRFRIDPDEFRPNEKEKKPTKTIVLNDQIENKPSIQLSFQYFSFTDNYEKIYDSLEKQQKSEYTSWLLEWIKFLPPCSNLGEFKKDITKEQSDRIQALQQKLISETQLSNKNFDCSTINIDQALMNMRNIIKNLNLFKLYLLLMLRVYEFRTRKMKFWNEINSVTELRNLMSVFAKLIEEKVLDKKKFRDFYEKDHPFSVFSPSMQDIERIEYKDGTWNNNSNNNNNLKPYISLNFVKNKNDQINNQLTFFPFDYKILESEQFDLNVVPVRFDKFSTGPKSIVEHEYRTFTDEPYILDFSENQTHNPKQLIIPRYFIPFKIVTKIQKQTPRNYLNRDYSCAVNQYQWNAGFALHEQHLLSLIIVDKRIYIMDLFNTDPNKKVYFESYQKYNDDRLDSYEKLNPPIVKESILDFSYIIYATFRRFFEEKKEITFNIFSHIYSHCNDLN
jgi:hypothetical protein